MMQGSVAVVVTVVVEAAEETVEAATERQPERTRKDRMTELCRVLVVGDDKELEEKEEVDEEVEEEITEDINVFDRRRNVD